MSDDLISIDEFLENRKDYIKGGSLHKASAGARSWDPKARTVRFVMSSEIEDRDKDIIYQAGLDVDGFAANPQALLFHNSRSWPVGNWKDIEKVLGGRPKRTEGTLQLMPEGEEENADRLARHLAFGTIRACSIGFIPKAVKRREKPEGADPDSFSYNGYDILEAELIECSPVTVPSNPAALAKDAFNGDKDAREVLEAALDTWKQHPEVDLIIPKSDFDEAYKDATGQRTSVVVTPPAAKEPAPAPSPQPSLFRRALNLFVSDDMLKQLDEQADKEPSAEAEVVVNALRAMQERSNRMAAARAKASVLKQRAEANLAKA